MNGYPIAAEALDLELYELACTIAASSELHRLGETKGGIRWILKTFELSELSRRLVSVAVTVRNMYETGWPENGPDRTVGTLISDETRPDDSQSLNLREACNKIIHAQDVSFFPGVSGLHETTPISGTIELRGAKRRNHWIAKLDLLDFIEAATIVT